MNRRERLLVGVIVTLVVVVAIDQLVVTPLLAAWSARIQAIQAAQRELSAARVLVNNADWIESRWRAYEAAGLAVDDSTARLRVQRQLSEWATQAGLNLTNFTSGRSTTHIVAGPSVATATATTPRRAGSDEDRFQELRFVVTGVGSLSHATAFLDALYASPFPLAVHELDLTSRSQVGHELTLRLTVSTLHRLRPAADAGGRP